MHAIWYNSLIYFNVHYDVIYLKHVMCMAWITFTYGC